MTTARERTTPTPRPQWTEYDGCEVGRAWCEAMGWVVWYSPFDWTVAVTHWPVTVATGIAPTAPTHTHKVLATMRRTDGTEYTLRVGHGIQRANGDIDVYLDSSNTGIRLTIVKL